MKRSEINRAITASKLFFEQNGWTLPPNPKWDVTDFGLGSFLSSGLLLVNLAEETEYCEKLMYAVRKQVTPSHMHKEKKEDIICRTGTLSISLWSQNPEKSFTQDTIQMKINGSYSKLTSGSIITLQAGERVTIEPGIWHEFYPVSEECIIGEVSTANDD
ncbi:MAG: D-lyxose/D-mannose family sugar isomerase, partial [Daejeonella sp.]